MERQPETPDRPKNPYTLVTERLVAMLEAGTVPWRQPWRNLPVEPVNLVTRRPYRGINWFLLLTSPFATPYWLTYRQTHALGGTIGAGEKGTPIVYWRVDEVENSETGERRRLFLLRRSTVFNVEQCRGLTAPPFERGADCVEPLSAGEAIWNDWHDRPRRFLAGNRAYYDVRRDQIVLPQPNRFDTHEEFAATMFHEMVHATGHTSRLDRGLEGAGFAFGCVDYSREELIAEMGSAFLCAKVGIDSQTISNSAAYLASWIHVLNGDSRLAVAAAGHAQRAVDAIVPPIGRSME